MSKRVLNLIKEIETATNFGFLSEMIGVTKYNFEMVYSSKT